MLKSKNSSNLDGGLGGAVVEQQAKESGIEYADIMVADQQD